MKRVEKGLLLLVPALALGVAAVGCAEEDEGERLLECKESGIASYNGSTYYYKACNSMCGGCFGEADPDAVCQLNGDQPYCPCHDAGAATFCWEGDGVTTVCDASTCE